MSTIDIGLGRQISYFTTGGEPSVIFLHGIMGSKKNLHTLVKRFVEVTGQHAIAFDLRNHGESSKNCAPFAVAATANDIVQAVKQLSITPKAIIGHSFGGKVALLAASALASLEQVWLLDSSPGVITISAPLVESSPTTMEIIDILASIKWPMPSRKDVVSDLLARGVSNGIALWMTTNLVADGDQVNLIFSPAEIKLMLEDFFHLDAWPVVQNLSSRMDVHLLAAELGGRVDEKDAVTLHEYAGDRGHFHVLKDAGHFVHADNLPGLIEIMRAYF